jgi:DNA-binding MarR family transcriptional regulator
MGKPRMTTANRDIVAALDDIGRGDATVIEATRTIRKALQAADGLADRVYAAFRNMTWRILTSRAFGPELPDWFDLIRHGSALAKQNSDNVLAERLRTLSDLIGQSSRFAEMQPLHEVLGRKHVVEILRLLATRGGHTRRSDLASATGLADANLSRVLVILSSRGLVERATSGKEANFSITDSGMAALKRHKTAPERGAPDTSGWWNDIDVAISVWDTEGRPVGCNGAFASIGERVGVEASSCDLETWRSRITEAVRDEKALPSEGARELYLGDARWIGYVDRATKSSENVICAYDISAHKARERDLEARLAIAVERAAKLSRDLASTQHRLTATEHRLAAHRAIVNEIREGLVETTAAASARVRRLDAILHSPSRETLSDQIQIVATQLGALQIAVRHFLDVPSISENPALLEVLNPRVFLTEAVKAASALGEPDISVTFGRLTERIRTSAAFRTVLGHILMKSTRLLQARGSAYVLHADTVKKCLVLSLGAPEAAKDADGGWKTLGGEVAFSAESEVVAALGLGYWRTFVEEYGGMLDIHFAPNTRNDFVKLTFPFKPIANSKAWGEGGFSR